MRQSSPLLAASVRKYRKPPSHDHGQHIYAFRHIRTNQVLYSLYRTPHGTRSLKQLPDIGANTPQATGALRRDHWRPLFSVSFPSAPSPVKPKDNAQGLHAFQKLREWRKLHEHYWTPPASLSQPYTEEQKEALEERLRERGGSKKETIYNMIKHQKKKIRREAIMDQKANSIADLAAVLIEQEQLAIKGASDSSERRMDEVKEMLSLASEAQNGGLRGLQRQISALQPYVERREGWRLEDGASMGQRQAQRASFQMKEKQRRMEFAAEAVQAAKTESQSWLQPVWKSSERVVQDIRQSSSSSVKARSQLQAKLLETWLRMQLWTLEQRKERMPRIQGDETGDEIRNSADEMELQSISTTETELQSTSTTETELQPISTTETELQSISTKETEVQEQIVAAQRKAEGWSEGAGEAIGSERVESGEGDVLNEYAKETVEKTVEDSMEEMTMQKMLGEESREAVEAKLREIEEEEAKTTSLERLQQLLALRASMQVYRRAVAEAEGVEDVRDVFPDTALPYLPAASAEGNESPPSDFLMYFHDHFPSFPAPEKLPEELYNRHAKRKAERSEGRRHTPVFSMRGVRVKWGELLDAEFARAWPADVVHEPMGYAKYSMPHPERAVSLFELSKGKVVDENAVVGVADMRLMRHSENSRKSREKEADVQEMRRKVESVVEQEVGRLQREKAKEARAKEHAADLQRQDVAAQRVRELSDYNAAFDGKLA